MATALAVGAQPAAAQSGQTLRFSLPRSPVVGPPIAPALGARAAWHPLRDQSTFRGRMTEDRNQFAAVRALRFDRSRSARTAIDAKLEWTLTGDLGGVDSKVGLAGLPRMLQRALEQ